MSLFGTYQLPHDHVHFLIIGVFDPVIVEICGVAVSAQVDLLGLWVGRVAVLFMHRLKTHGRVCEYPLIDPVTSRLLRYTPLF